MRSTVLRYSATAVVAIGAAARQPPAICMLSPLATVQAGQSVTATLDNQQGRPCEATLVFADENFLPVTFSLQPTACLGFQQAELTIPLEVPNGEVTILWECAGDGIQSCSRAILAGGLSDAYHLLSQQTGIVDCIVPTATLTTLSTVVQGTSTVITALVETQFSTSKDFTTASTTTSTSATPTDGTTATTDTGTSTSTDSATAMDSGTGSATTTGSGTTTESATTWSTTWGTTPTTVLIVPAMMQTSSTSTVQLESVFSTDSSVTVSPGLSTLTTQARIRSISTSTSTFGSGTVSSQCPCSTAASSDSGSPFT